MCEVTRAIQSRASMERLTLLVVRYSICPLVASNWSRVPAKLGSKMQALERSNGRPDAVFANAGVLFMGPNEDITEAQKKLLVDVNIMGVINTVDAAFPFLKQTPHSHIVAMSSTSAEYGAPPNRGVQRH